MSIQGAINQAIGTAGQTAAITKVLKTQDPEYQEQKAKEQEQRDIESHLKTNQAVQQELSKQAHKQGKSELELAGSTSEAGNLYRELQGEELELSKRALYNNPTPDALRNYARNAVEYKAAQARYDKQRQMQANKNATSQAQAKVEQKQAILTNINQ